MDTSNPGSSGASNTTTQTTPPAVPSWTVTSPQRDPPVFAGLRGDDVDDWIDNYDRVSSCNKWNDTQKLRHVAFYLTGVAKTWYFNHESDIADWSTFTTKLRQIFASSSGRAEVAKQKLGTRLQLPQESYTSYIEDVLALCRRANPSMTEAERVRHVLKGIGSVAFNALIVQNPASVQDITSTCQRLDELQSLRLQHDSSDPQVPHNSDLRALIRTIIREELQMQDLRRSPPACAPTPTFNLREVVKQELTAMTTPTTHLAPVARPTPTYAEVVSLPAPTVTSVPTDVTYDHLASMGTRPLAAPSYPQWRPPRPVCFYCGIRGHISRFCRRRQQDERRGYAEHERDRTRRPDAYYPGSYSFPQQRSPSPPSASNLPHSSRSARRRSPSPYRRSTSPLRPTSHLADQHSEN